MYVSRGVCIHTNIYIYKSNSYIIDAHMYTYKWKYNSYRIYAHT
jgi:hypothetical protein